MTKITHSIYKDYPEHPYISPARDLELWEKTPEVFPYSRVEKRQMERLPEGVLPGDIVMLWRINFDNFTSTTVIPQYFEYRYGIDSDESIKILIQLGYIEVGSAKDSLDVLNMVALKKILVENELDTKGKKAIVFNRIMDSVTEEKLAKQFSLRKYKSTPSGKELLEKYDAIIQKHGPKM